MIDKRWLGLGALALGTGILAIKWAKKRMEYYRRLHEMFEEESAAAKSVFEHLKGKPFFIEIVPGAGHKEEDALELINFAKVVLKRYGALMAEEREPDAYILRMDLVDKAHDEKEWKARCFLFHGEHTRALGEISARSEYHGFGLIKKMEDLAIAMAGIEKEK